MINVNDEYVLGYEYLTAGFKIVAKSKGCNYNDCNRRCKGFERCLRRAYAEGTWEHACSKGGVA